MDPFRPPRVPRWPRTVATTAGLALLTGLLHVVLLPATPAAGQEVADGNLLDHEPAAAFDIASRSPRGTRVGEWRVEEFHRDNDITVYRIRSDSNRRSIAIATRKRAASHDDLHAIQVKGDVAG